MCLVSSRSARCPVWWARNWQGGPGRGGVGADRGSGGEGCELYSGWDTRQAEDFKNSQSVAEEEDKGGSGAEVEDQQWFRPSAGASEAAESGNTVKPEAARALMELLCAVSQGGVEGNRASRSQHPTQKDLLPSPPTVKRRQGQVQGRGLGPSPAHDRSESL